MKLRNGFVSNSSSSSFIIGYGVVKDMDKLKKYLGQHNLTMETNKQLYYDSVNLTGPNDWDDHREQYEQYEYDNHWNRIGDPKYGIAGGNNTVIYFPDELPYMKDILLVQVLNDEGDGMFHGDDDSYCFELDYSPAFKEEYYHGWQRDLIELLKNKDDIFEHVEFKFGAERNG